MSDMSRVVRFQTLINISCKSNIFLIRVPKNYIPSIYLQYQTFCQGILTGDLINYKLTKHHLSWIDMRDLLSKKNICQ